MKRRIFTFLLVLVLALGTALPAGAYTKDSRMYVGPLEDRDPDAWIQRFEQDSGWELFTETTSYQSTATFNYGQTITVTLYGVRGDDGSVLFPAEYSGFHYISDDRIVARLPYLGEGTESSRVGIVTSTGEVVLPFQTNIRDFIPIEEVEEPDEWTRGFFADAFSTDWTVTDPLVGLYDWDGTELLPPIYTSIVYQGNGLYRMTAESVSEGVTASLYNRKTGAILSGDYNSITKVGDDLFEVRDDLMLCGLIDGQGRDILPMIFADITSAGDGYYAVGLFRSPDDYANSLEDRGALVAETWLGADVSEVPSYAVYGIIDDQYRVVSDFTYERASIRDGAASLSAWNGEYQPWNPLNLPAPTYIKKYDVQTVPLDELKPTGQMLWELALELLGGGVELPGTPAPTVGGFTDVPADAYYAQPVLWAVENGITAGTSATTFSPDETCTTAQIVTFLWRASGSPAVSGGTPFSDVSADEYYYQAALWAREAGLVSGSLFRGDAPCTRAATVTYLWKLAGQPAAGASGFSDVPAGADYAQAVAWAVGDGITSGTSATTFSPDSICTRGQIVTFLYQDRT